MEPARTALSICAELPDCLEAQQPLALPQPHLLRGLPCLFLSSFALSLSPPLTTFIFWKNLTGALLCGEAQDSWACGLTKHCASAGTLRAAGELLQPPPAQGRCFCHVTAVKNEICASGARQTHSSVLESSLVSQVVPDPPSDSPGCACADNRRQGQEDHPGL